VGQHKAVQTGSSFVVMIHAECHSEISRQLLDFAYVCDFNCEYIARTACGIVKKKHEKCVLTISLELCAIQQLPKLSSRELQKLRC
jgi:hypothetical protein